MKLVSREISPSPDRVDTTRVSVQVRMEEQGRELDFWFDVPAQYEAEISDTGNPWLVLLTPLAIHSGEDIVLPYPVDPHLLENMQAMMRFWANRYPGLRPARIEAPAPNGAPRKGGKSALFFSGGVDSTFSLLRHDKEVAGSGSQKVDDLIFVAGFDIPVDDTAEIELVKAYLGRVASARDKTFIPFATNLRQLDTPYATNWILSYGCALGAAAHLLGARYREAIVSAAHTYPDSPVTGSHPITDPLLSSRNLRFVHDGAAFNRVEKTQQIAATEGALDALRVCWEDRRHDNCSRCRKCLLTMVTLDLAGLRNRASCFDWSAYSLDDIRSQFLDTDVQVTFFREVLADARRRGRRDVEEAVAEAIESSLRARRVIEWARRLPILWRFDDQLRRILLRRRQTAPIALPSTHKMSQP
jgi:hypothetical protein